MPLCGDGELTLSTWQPVPPHHEQKYFKMALRWHIQLFCENKFLPWSSVFVLVLIPFFDIIMDLMSNCVVPFLSKMFSPQAGGVLCAMYKVSFSQCLSQATQQKFLALKAFKHISGMCGFLCSVNADRRLASWLNPHFAKSQEVLYRNLKL